MHLLTLSKIFGINSDLMEFFSFVIAPVLTAFVGFFEMGLHISCVSAHFPFSIKSLLVKIKIKICTSSDDGTCRIWDARYSNLQLRVYMLKPSDILNGKSNGLSSNRPSSSNDPQSHQILCCAYNANGTVFVTGSSDTFARVWRALKFTQEDLD